MASVIENPFLKIAKQLTTPVKKKEEGAKDEDLTPTPVTAKKTCPTFEKWLKKQDGDVSLLRDTLTWKQIWCGLIISAMITVGLFYTKKLTTWDGFFSH